MPVPVAAATLGIPKLLYWVAAGLFGADLASKMYGQQRGIGVQEKGLGLQEKQMMMGAAMGKRERKRADELMQQLLTFQKGEKRDVVQAGMVEREGMRNQQTMAMLMALLNQQANAPQPAAPERWPSASMVGLLRR